MQLSQLLPCNRRAACVSRRSFPKQHAHVTCRCSDTRHRFVCHGCRVYSLAQSRLPGGRECRAQPLRSRSTVHNMSTVRPISGGGCGIADSAHTLCATFHCFGSNDSADAPNLLKGKVEFIGWISGELYKVNLRKGPASEESLSQQHLAKIPTKYSRPTLSLSFAATLPSPRQVAIYLQSSASERPCDHTNFPPHPKGRHPRLSNLLPQTQPAKHSSILSSSHQIEEKGGAQG